MCYLLRPNCRGNALEFDAMHVMQLTSDSSRDPETLMDLRDRVNTCT